MCKNLIKHASKLLPSPSPKLPPSSPPSLKLLPSEIQDRYQKKLDYHKKCVIIYESQVEMFSKIAKSQGTENMRFDVGNYDNPIVLLSENESVINLLILNCIWITTFH
ncbi:hypothetical protein DICPUDRAFT_83545 [Dictyostelium purpureum]|uniref:Uncharacterized protein n=1 Tax=Dictyostelium purpureum TaxID=5786 RepID=F0ZZU7_DICPU|nr:uncharacterized protein DICPUDRAFT_83545 [Dictyostelium purpureum]EGC30546.1 hypothetical protein DICPUDRAFT_83545 [Dictyostelium purpureum]|eukprot:XP_003292941.1 hypothetical protein DICPUDRAFT_83545 [Dictyostelium purpureum]